MRVVFIGTGGIARRHASGLAKRDDLVFAGAYDIDPGRAEDFAAQYGGEAYFGLTEMLDAARPDAAWVCLPPFVHGDAERALLERRIPFLVEKPISNSLDTARSILEQIESTGTLVAVGYLNRYRRGITRARELLQNDPAVLLHGAWVGGTPGVPWWRIKAQSGGQIVEQTTHIFDLARYLVGEPTLVYAQGTRGFVHDMPGYDVEDASAVTICFDGGAVGSMVSCCAGRTGGGGVQLCIVATHHYVSFSGWDQTTVIQKSRIEQERIGGEPDIFEIEDDAFIQAVDSANRSLVLSPYSDAIKTLAFTLAANESMETGRPVQVATP